MSRIDSRVDSFDSLCRLCATYDAVKLEIFGQEGKERSLVEKIQTCLPFQVSKNDPLPKSLCYRCMYNLENFYDFRMGCVSAVALLESCLHPDGGKNLDRTSAEKREKIMKQMQKDTSRILETSMPQLEPEIPLAKSVKEEPDVDGKVKKRSPTANNLMPKLPSAVKDDGGNTDDDLEEIDEDEEDEKVIDIDPADYLESNVAVEVEESQQSNLPSKKSILGSQTSPQKPSEPCELFTCKICGKALSSKGHLSLHLRIHRDDPSDSNCLSTSASMSATSTPQGTQFCRPYRCDLCNKSYSSSKHLWGHVSSNHRGDPAVTCPECHRLFSSVNNLEEHKRSKHGDHIEPVDEFMEVDYSTSPRTPSGKSRLNNDDDSPTLKIKYSSSMIDSDGEYNQNGKRPASDEAAGNRRKRSKPRKIARTNSSESHGEEGDGEPLQCVLCLDTFPDVAQLMDHTKKHEEEHEAETQAIAQAHAQPMMNSQNLSCLLCERTFTLRSLLHRHLEIQHGIDPADLDAHDSKLDIAIKSECDDLMNDDEDQDHHMLAESMLVSETVFCCEVCIREFPDRSSLWLHMLYTHKPAAATACGLCLKVCGDFPSLTSHIQACHTTSQLLVEKRRYSCSICMRQHDSRKKLLSHVTLHEITTAKPEDLIILNSDLYQAENQVEMDNDEQDSHENSLNATSGGLNVSASSGNAAVTAAAAVAANSPFACQICLKIFPNEEKMVKHKQNAHRQDALVHAASGVGTYHLFFRCELCGVSHQSKADRWKHVYEVHGGDPSVTCSKSSCGKVFPSAELNVEHVNHHKVQGSTPNTCEICGKLWNSRVDYWKHMMGVHAEVVPFTCGVCLKVLPDLFQLKDHVKSRHYPLTGGDYCCDICGRPYSNRSKMSRHRRIHFSLPGEDDQETPAEDETPTKVSSEKNTVAIKVEAVDGVKKPKSGNVHRCDGCPNRTFGTREELIQHRRADHGMLTCDLCDKFYGRTSHLWKHVNKMHRGHPSVTCNHCGKISASKSHLRSHVLKLHRPGVLGTLGHPETLPVTKPQIKAEPEAEPQPKHEKQKTERVLGPQACPQCSKVFCNRYRMLRHLKSCRMNPGWEKQVKSNPVKDRAVFQKVKGPVTCPHCSKEFMSKRALHEHEQKNHTMYDCELCGQGTIPSKTALMEHIMIAHRGAEQITCSVEECGMTLRCSADRVKHEKEHQNSRNIPTCSKCGELCTSKSRLKLHMKTDHKITSSILCSICLAIHPEIDDLKAHVKAKHPQVLGRANSCQVCGRSFDSRGHLVGHVKSCHDGASRLCTICLGFFANQEELKEHIEAKHTKKDREEEEESDSSSSDDENGKENENDVEEDDIEEDDDEDDDDEEEDEDEEDNDEEEEDDDEEEEEGEGEDEEESQESLSIEENSKADSDMSELTLNGVDPDESKQHSDLASDEVSSGSEHSGKDPNAQLPSTTEGRPRRAYKCNICKETFRMPSLLMQHQKQRHRSGSIPMQCPTCDKKFSNKLIFTNHVNLCKREKSSILQQTLESGKMGFRDDPKEVAKLAEIAGFNGHFLEGGDEGKESQANFSSRPNRIQRKVYGENEGPIHCPLCNKIWPSLRQQWQHLIRTHREAAATTCGVCLEICSGYSKLKAHLNEMHPDTWEGEGKNFTCRTCGRYHNARSKLELHNSIHLGLEGDVPPAEDLQEHSKSNLPQRGSTRAAAKAARKESEGSENPSSVESEDLSEDMQLFVCPACSMVFQAEEALADHMESKCEHSAGQGTSGKAVYSCQRCNNATFSSYLNLTKHYKQCPNTNESEPRPDSNTKEESDLSNGVDGNDNDDSSDSSSSSNDQDGSSSSSSSSGSDSSSSSSDDSEDEENHDGAEEDSEDERAEGSLTS